MRKKTVILLLVVCLLFSCSACGGKSEADPSYVISERAMENFVKKLEKGNYVVDVPGKVKTVVVSPEQAYFLYDYEDDYGHGFMTLKGETFETVLEGSAVTEVRFKASGDVLTALGSLLPNSWKEISGGNLFELFYNNIDDPLEFTTQDENIKMTLASLGGYSGAALDVMQEVHMRFDSEDPKSVHFTAKIGDGSSTLIRYDDLDLTLEFGTASSDARLDKWLKSPFYPPVRTGWTQNDVYTLDAVFSRGYGESAVPFPTFASYALIFDPNAYAERTMIILSDAHGTEKDLEDYKAALLSSGYKEATVQLEDGSSAAVYRKLLRGDYRSYAQLYPYMDGGFVLEGSMWYDNPVYENLSEINAVIENNGFPAMDETGALDGFRATDTSGERSESWAYYFDYALYMPFMLNVNDMDEAKKYVEAYGKKLTEKGFSAAYQPGEDSARYTSADDFTSFRYTFNDDDTVIFEFKREKNLTAEQANALAASHGIPQPNFRGAVGCRDLTRYYYIIGQFEGLYLSVYQPFAGTADAEAYLDEYVARLDEEGYLMTYPRKIGSQRSFAYLNEEVGKYVAFDLFSDEDGATVFMEMVSSEANRAELLQQALGY